MTAILGTVGSHLVVDHLNGSATVTLHRGFGPYCVPVGSVMLDPDQVLALATELTQASVPPPPVVERRMVVRRRPDGLWFVICPECFPLDAAWHDQPEALAAALEHLTTEHASEVSA